MKTKFLVLSITSLLLAGTALAAGNDNTGTSCANFLKLGVGPRAMAMGGAYVALADDYSALYWNPAGLAHVEGLQVGFAYNDWVLDIQHNYFGAVYSLGNLGAFGVNLNTLDYGEMEATTPSEPYGTGVPFSASDLEIGVAYARQLTDRFTVGAKFKFIHESISYSSGNAIAVDAGTQFVTGFHGMRIGMAISNFGGKMTLRGTDQLTKADVDEVIDGNPMKEARLETKGWPLPLTYRMGVSMDFLNRADYKITVNADFIDPRDMNPYGNLGTEIGWNNFVFLRGGVIYQSKDFDEAALANDDELELNYAIRFAFGGGVNFTVPGMNARMRLDYAYTDLGLLNYSHRLALVFSL